MCVCVGVASGKAGSISTAVGSISTVLGSISMYKEVGDWTLLAWRRWETGLIHTKEVGSRTERYGGENKFEKKVDGGCNNW